MRERKNIEGLERMSSMGGAGGGFGSCSSCRRLTSRLHELHESGLPLVLFVEFVRSKLSNFSARVHTRGQCRRVYPS